MGQDTVGTIRKLLLDGVSYRLAADINVSQIMGTYEKEMLATSGAGMLKMTKRIPQFESVTVTANGLEMDQIKTFNEQIDDITLALEDAAGNTWRANGAINCDPRETDTGRINIALLPREEWTFFAA